MTAPWNRPRGRRMADGRARRRAFRALAVLALAALAWPLCGGVAAARDRVDTAKASERRGMMFAYRWCFTCHMDSQTGAPPFERLAAEREITLEFLRAYTANPPHGMLRFELEEKDLVDLRRYILSLQPGACRTC